MSQLNHEKASNMHPMPLLGDIFPEWPSHVTDLNITIKAENNITALKKYLDLQIIQIYQKELPSKNVLVSTFELLRKAEKVNVGQLKKINRNELTPYNERELLIAVGWLLKHGFAKNLSMIRNSCRYWLALHRNIKKPIGGVKQMHRLAETK